MFAGTAVFNLSFGFLSPLNDFIAHVSENSSIVTLSVLVTGNIFSVMFGRIFDAHSTPTKYGMRCLAGARCYSASLYVTTLACLGGLILARVAARRDRTYK